MVPVTIIALLYWTAGTKLRGGVWWYEEEARHLIEMGRYWQKLVFHYCLNAYIYNAEPGWTESMIDLVSRLTAGGITCVCVDQVFMHMKSLNLQKTLNKWCNSPAAVNILAEHLRSRIMAIHRGAGVGTNAASRTA